MQNITNGDDFYHEVVREAKESGISELISAYQVLDKMTAEHLVQTDDPIACGAGCSFCCHQLIVVTVMEWAEIEKFLIGVRDGKLRYELNRRLKESNKLWLNYDRSLGLRKKTMTAENTLRTYRDWLGKAPCPFLNAGGKCDVYPVRPICCRTYTSPIKCTSWGDSGAQQLRFEFQSWANEAITQIVGLQNNVVIPVPYFAGTIKL